MLAGAGDVQRGPEVAVVRFQIGPNVDKKPHTLRTSAHAGLVERGRRVEGGVDLGPVGEQQFHALHAA